MTEPAPETKSVLGWVDKIMFLAFAAIVVGLGTWNLHTAHQNSIQIAELSVEIRNLKDNEDMENLEKRVEKLEDAYRVR